MSKQQILLSTSELSVGYRNPPSDKILFHHIGVNLHRGELVCFMGPNGTGKSTLIRTLAGIKKPLQGEIAFPSHQSLTMNKRIAVVLTDRVATANMTALDLISFGRYPYLNWNLKPGKDDRAAIENAIALTNVKDFLHQKLHELSDGQIQLAMIARALAQECEIILLDEPTAHLDLNNRVEIMNLLRQLAHESGKAILLTTHDLHLALQMADTIWLAGKNKSILTGIPEDLILNGAFDEIFRLKGFDLRTGKVSHPIHTNREVVLQGEGAALLWTKNALERSGFQLGKNGLLVSVIQSPEGIVWILKDEKFFTLKNLLEKLL